MKEPKHLFIIDGIGALLSAFLLGVVLVAFESTFGIPRKTLLFLASIPILFAVFDVICFLNVKTKIAVSLKAIATVNLLYCLLSITLAVSHHQTITLWGWTYVSLEIAIVSVLLIVEFRTAHQIKVQK